MSNDIQKEPVSPLSAEPPRDQSPNSDGAFGPAPRFARMVWAAGAVWIVAGSLLLLVAPAVLYAVWPWLLELPHAEGQLAALFVVSALLIVPALSGAAFLRAGIRIVRDAAPRRPRKGLAVYSLVFGFLLAFLGLYELETARENINDGSGKGWKLIPFAVLTVTVSPLLLTAGVLALAGGSQYKLWRMAQMVRGEREGGEADNPFRK